jgi:hypothetical protein
MNSSMSRPFAPNVLTVGQQFVSRSSRRETRLPAQRWGIELEKGKALEVRDFAGMIMFLRVSGEGLLDARISTSWREGGARCYLPRFSRLGPSHSIARRRRETRAMCTRCAPALQF